MNKTLCEQLNEAPARIEMILHIGGMGADEYSLAEALDDFIADDTDELLDLFSAIPESVREDLDDRDARGPAFMDWALQNDVLGFLIQMATPIRRNQTSSGFSYSWGYYQTKWVYGDTIEEAVKNGLAWVEEFSRTVEQ